MIRIKRVLLKYGLLLCLAAFASTAKLVAQSPNVNVDWNKVLLVSKTTATLQVVENPRLRLPSSFHDSAFKVLKELGADYVRYVPWFPYPKLAVAELKAPTATETFWDFRYMDSTMNDIMQATQGHSVVINFSTTPGWMWKTAKVFKYPDDPYQVCWDYNQGTQLRDPTCKELADYYGRMFQWYTKGGFTDELGKYHKSGHYYKITYWEILNEPDAEHSLSPQLYSKIYDAIVLKLKSISPGLKFVGLALAFESNPEWYEYFLNPKNHKPGVPLDAISYHHYSTPSFSEQTIDAYQYTFFEKANGFLDKVRYIENIRKRLSPHTITTINEIGTILGIDYTKIPESYWNLSGALYAYIWLECTKIGIDVAGESQLVGYPTQYPDVSLMNWENGNPNAKFWTLKLLKNNFGPGDKLVSSSCDKYGMICQAFLTAGGKRLLLINTSNKEIQLRLPPEFQNVLVNYVDISTNEKPPAHTRLTGDNLEARLFSVQVLQIE
jgi:hypothetical protein